MAYDDQNIFAKILRGEIPCKKLHEDEHTLAFSDIAPKKKVHILVIPKGNYADYAAFVAEASDAAQLAFSRAVLKMIKDAGLEQAGYRLITNSGAHGGQEVPHYHVHILGGESVGPLVS